MSSTGATPDAPPTIEVVAVKVAEQLMTDMYDRIAELEARLELVEREADEAEQVAEAAFPDGTGFSEVAQQLLERAGQLRTAARTLVPTAVEPDPVADALVLQLPSTRSDPEPG